MLWNDIKNLKNFYVDGNKSSQMHGLKLKIKSSRNPVHHLFAKKHFLKSWLNIIWWISIFVRRVICVPSVLTTQPWSTCFTAQSMQSAPGIEPQKCTAFLKSSYPGIILSMRPAIERRRNSVTPSFIAWAPTLNSPCISNTDMGKYTYPSGHI